MRPIFNRYALMLLLLAAGRPGFAQKGLPAVEIVAKDVKTSLRGLSVVSDAIIWASGSNGTVGRSTDGGKKWKWLSVKGFETRDFRDIEAFDASTAIIMAVDTPAYILKTTNGGLAWTVVYENRKAGMFLDALEFWNDRAGIVIGDPIDNRLFIARTFDGGTTWKELPDQYKPVAGAGEALFAASGTNIRALDKDEAVFVTGGETSRLFIRDQATRLPLLQGSASAGANSIAVMDNHSIKGGRTMMVVGGDFTRPAVDSLNCFYSHDRGRTWKAPKIPPHGYRSCVEYLSKTHLLACGITGVDYTTNGGITWSLISSEGFNVCRIAKNGSAIFLAGNGGKIGRLRKVK